MKVIADRNVLVSRDELIKINNALEYYSTRKKIKEYLDTNELEVMIPASFIVEISEEFTSSIEYDILRFDLTKKNVSKVLEEELSHLLEQCDIPLKLLTEEDGKLVAHSEVISQVYEIILLGRKLHKLNDYMTVKHDIDKDLKYFCSEETILQFDRAYQEQLNSLNMEGIAEILNKGYSLILEHWKSYVTDLKDFAKGKPYNLLCHSTDSTEFNGPFYTKYVSCSLLCEQLTDTYNSGYGFILSPDNIVMAGSKDLYVRNEADNEEDLSSSVKKISSPERVKEEALQAKEKLGENKSNVRVYTEVVLNGFHPIGIFCMYDGSKTLNDNYKNALKLKENFPELEITLLDVMFQKKDFELDKIKRKLVNRIAEATGILKLNHTYEKYTFYKNFDLFWNKYLVLIKQENYNEQDIIELFKENLELISPEFNLNQYLFDGTYSDDQLKQLFYYNPQIRIIDIMEGNITVSLLENVYNVLKYYLGHPKLESIVPGISSFLKIYPNVILDEASVRELSECDSLESLIQYLKGKEKNAQANESEFAPNYEVQIGALEQERVEAGLAIQEFKNSEACLGVEPSYEVAQKDVFSIQNEINDYSSFIEQSESQIALLQSDINNSHERITNFSRHKILNTIRITGLKKKIEMNQTSTFDLATQISQSRKRLESLMNELQEVKNRFREKTGFSFDTYREKLSKSTVILNNIDIVNVRIRVSMLTAAINKVKSLLEKQGAKGSHYELEGVFRK